MISGLIYKKLKGISVQFSILPLLMM